ncbi:unnamed protein product [Phaeothamnion confervicola]
MEAQQWIEAVLGKSVEGGFGDSLKDGVLLCELINAIEPGSVRRVNDSKMPFKQMENVSAFLRACRAVGVPEHSLFETVDLYEQKDISLVVKCLHALGGAVQRTCPNFTGPHLGVRPGGAAAAGIDAASGGSAGGNGNVLMSPRGGVGNGASSGALARATALAKAKLEGLTIDGQAAAAAPAPSTVSPQHALRPAVTLTAEEEIETARGEGPAVYEGQGQVRSNIPLPASEPVRGGVGANGQREYVGARGGGYGLDADLAQKRAATYDYNAELQAQQWVEAVTGRPFDGAPFGAALKDGVRLCALVNGIRPGVVARINESRMPFKQMENISNFLRACRALGVAEHSLFETVDLFEEKDLSLVVTCLHALGGTVQRTCPGFVGPHLGVRAGDANVREWTPQQREQQQRASAAGMTKVMAGSQSTMARKEHVVTGITMGADYAGIGDTAATSQMSIGSAGIMERAEVSRAGNVTFGADAGARK